MKGVKSPHFFYDSHNSHGPHLSLLRDESSFDHVFTPDTKAPSHLVQPTLQLSSEPPWFQGRKIRPAPMTTICRSWPWLTIGVKSTQFYWIFLTVGIYCIWCTYIFHLSYIHTVLPSCWRCVETSSYNSSNPSTSFHGTLLRCWPTAAGLSAI